MVKTTGCELYGSDSIPREDIVLIMQSKGKDYIRRISWVGF